MADYERLFTQALEAGRERDYLKASNLLLRIVSETDEMPQAYLYLGRSYHAAGNYDLAIQFLKIFTEIRPGIGAGRFFLGRAYLARNLPVMAAEQLNAAVAMDPENPHAHALLGLSWLKARRSDLGAEALGRAVELDPENSELYNGYRNALLVDAIRKYRAGDIDLARQMFTFLLDSGLDGPLPVLYLAALEKASGNYDEALRWYDRAVFFNTEDPLIHLQRASVLAKLGRTSEALEIYAAFGVPATEETDGMNTGDVDRFMAEESYRKGHLRKAILFAKRVIKRSGPDYDMHLLLGEAFRIQGSYTKAKNHFSRAHEIARDGIEPLYGIAMVLWHRDKWVEMLDYLGRIERLSPEDSIAAYYRALCVCRLEEPPELTIPQLQKALRKNETDEYLAAALGNEYLRDNRPDLAEKWFHRSLEHAPAHREAFLGLLRTYELLKNRPQEVDTFKKYLRRYPDDIKSRVAYIHLLLEAEDYGDAVNQIQTALTYRDGDGELTRLLAFCYRMSDQYREAAVVYRNLLKEDPKNEEFLRALCYCLESSGNRKTAVSLMEKAIDYLDPSAELKLIYGVLLFREGDLDSALQQFRDVLGEAPREWRACKNIAMIYRKRGIADLAEKFMAQAEKYRGAGQTGLVDHL